MSSYARSSRLRYQQYRRDFKDHKTEGTSRTGAGHAIHKKSQRSFFSLFGSFYKLLHNYRVTIAIALALVASSTLLALIPPYSIKLIVDNVLGRQPLPSFLAETLRLPQDKRLLLMVVVFSFIASEMDDNFTASTVPAHVPAGVVERTATTATIVSHAPVKAGRRRPRATHPEGWHLPAVPATVGCGCNTGGAGRVDVPACRGSTCSACSVLVPENASIGGHALVCGVLAGDAAHATASAAQSAATDIERMEG